MYIFKPFLTTFQLMDLNIIKYTNASQVLIKIEIIVYRALFKYDSK